jgi:hypothetical protein
LGTTAKKLILPRQDFAYGLANKPSTPIKNVINFSYGNEAAQGMKRSYSQILFESSQKEKLIPKLTKHFEKCIELKKIKRNESLNMKPLFKIKKYLNVTSKVKQNLKVFKTFNTNKHEDQIDKLICRVEKEINQLDQM